MRDDAPGSIGYAVWIRVWGLYEGRRERYRHGNTITQLDLRDVRFNDLEGEGGAGSRIRTRDPLITNQMLYQLSYTGVFLALSLRPNSVLVSDFATPRK